MVGIVSYGAYIPRYRISVPEIASAWGKNGLEISASLGISQKSVPGIDEDAVTLAYEAASQALNTINLSPQSVEALFVGSESHPYAVNPTATIVGEFLGLGNSYLAADLQFACKAATAGICAITGLVSANKMRYGMSIGADTAQSRPHDALEYTSAAASCAILIGQENLVAKLVDFVSFSSDTPDFWRRDGIRYPSHAGRFTGMPAYFTHVMGAGEQLLAKLKKNPRDFTYAVFHMPNGKFPKSVANQFGFTQEQISPSLIVKEIGNPYSASSLIGLALVLDQAKPGETIFMVSYGSGAGSDAFVWEVNEAILSLQQKRRSAKILVENFLKSTKKISYSHYLRQTHKL